MTHANDLSRDFYQEWLGIPSGPRPPDHYRLLGLQRLESDPSVVEKTARSQMKRVRTRCLKYPEVGTKLLNEIAAAKVCLLDPARKDEYDRLLIGQAAAPATVAPPTADAKHSAVFLTQAGIHETSVTSHQMHPDQATSDKVVESLAGDHQQAPPYMFRVLEDTKPPGDGSPEASRTSPHGREPVPDLWTQWENRQRRKKAAQNAAEGSWNEDITVLLPIWWGCLRTFAARNVQFLIGLIDRYHHGRKLVLAGCTVALTLTILFSLFWFRGWGSFGTPTDPMHASLDPSKAIANAGDSEQAVEAATPQNVREAVQSDEAQQGVENPGLPTRSTSAGSTRGPTIRIARVEPEEPTEGGTLHVQLTATDPEDDEASFEFRVGPSDEWQQAILGQVNLSDLQSGPLTLYVRARDRLGQTSPVLPRTWVVKEYNRWLAWGELFTLDSPGQVQDLAFSSDGCLLAGAGEKLRIWRVSTDKPTSSQHAIACRSVAFSPSEMILACGMDDYTIRLLQVTAGDELQVVRSLKGHTREVNSMAFSPDGKLLASASSDQTMKLWQVADGALQRTFDGHTGKVSSVAFSPDNQFLASASFGRVVQLWRVFEAQPVRSMKKSGDKVAFSTDGDLLACLDSAESRLYLHQVIDSNLPPRFGAYSESAVNLVFSPDGRTLVTGRRNRTIGICRVSDGLLLQTLEGHTDSIVSLALSPDGRTLASASQDGTIRLWGEPTPNKGIPGQSLADGSSKDKDGSVPEKPEKTVRKKLSPDETNLQVIKHEIGGKEDDWFAVWFVSETTDYKGRPIPHRQCEVVQGQVEAAKRLSQWRITFADHRKKNSGGSAFPTAEAANKRKEQFDSRSKAAK